MNEEMATRDIPVFQIKMFEPEHMELAQVLQDGLRKHFEEATVEWVDCPNLTQAPFNHAAKGLCGDAMLLKIGRNSNPFCQIPQMLMRYDFKHILKAIYCNNNNAFIIGEGFGLRKSIQQFGNLSMNASFWQILEDFYCINNQSNLRFWNHLTEKFVYESIDDSNLACYIHGTFFISEGKPGKVLRVYARKPFTSIPIALKLHQVLSEKYSFLLSSLPSLNYMGNHMSLCGTILTKYGVTNQPVICFCDDQFKTSENINNWLYHANFTNLYPPEKANVTIRVDKIKYSDYFSLSNQEKIYGSSEFNSKIPPYNVKTKSNCTVEILGYLYPAKTLYLIDPHSALTFEYDS